MSPMFWACCQPRAKRFVRSFVRSSDPCSWRSWSRQSREPWRSTCWFAIHLRSLFWILARARVWIPVPSVWLPTHLGGVADRPLVGDGCALHGLCVSLGHLQEPFLLPTSFDWMGSNARWNRSMWVPSRSSQVSLPATPRPLPSPAHGRRGRGRCFCGESSTTSGSGGALGLAGDETMLKGPRQRMDSRRNEHQQRKIVRVDDIHGGMETTYVW